MLRKEFIIAIDSFFCYNHNRFFLSMIRLSLSFINSMAGVLINYFSKREVYALNKNYITFLDMVANCIRDVYKEEVIVEHSVSTKNNGVQMEGLMLRKVGEQVAPNFYLNQQFEEWKQGIKSLYEIVTEICHVFEEELQNNQHLAQTICFEWEVMKESIFLRLINRDKNIELLKKIPYMEFMDLAVVYFYSVDISKEVQGTVVLTKEHLQLLGVTIEQLHQTAMENTRNLRPVKVYQMGDLIEKVGKKLGIEGLACNTEINFMYLFSNESNMFGAIAMFFEEELKQFAEKLNSSFYVLPSSIHEVILVPDNKMIAVDKFVEMVQDINATQVQETEILSDSVYYYDKIAGQLRRVG